MIVAVVITVGSILLGAILGAATRSGSRWLGPLRTFAIAAVAAAVVVQLLPESVSELGAPALLVFVGALALPGLLAPLLRRVPPMRGVSAGHLGVEFGFVAFLVHQVAEGFALGTYSGGGHGGHDGHDHSAIIIAVAAHTLPLTAVFIAEALVHHGRSSAIRRTIGLALATSVGFTLADVALVELQHEVHPWLSAGIAGFLVHVVFHHHEEHGQSRSVAVSALDVLGAAVGVGLPLLASQWSGGHGEELREAVTEAFAELLVETAPMLLLGLAIGAGLQVVGSRIPSRYFTTGGAWRQAARGVAVGAPLPLCACGVLPIAESLRRRGAGPALVMAFLMATPELGPETLTLTVRFLGWPFAIARIASALGLAVLAAVLFDRWVRADRRRRPEDPDAGQTMLTGEVAAGRRPSLARVYGYFDELLLHTAPWTFVGLLAAAYVQAVLPEGSLAPLREMGLDVWVVALVAMPSYVCAASATPLAAVLILKGVSPGAVLVGLLLGPATNIATIGVLRKGYGGRAMALGLATVFALAVALAYAVNLLGLDATVPQGLEDEHAHGPVAMGAVVILGVVLLAQLWRWGARPWLEILHGGHDHEHDHDHGHDHEHGHGHDDDQQAEDRASSSSGELP